MTSATNIPFIPDRLMAEARSATGLTEFGSSSSSEAQFRELFCVLCTSLEEEAQLSPLGRGRAHERLHMMLCSRLRHLQDRRANSAIEAVQIRAPLIGIGLPRAGTTFLHGLLALDPANRSPRAWEAALPSPPPRPGAEESDPRADQYERLLDQQGFLDADLRAIHPFGSRLPEEDTWLWEAELGPVYSAFWNIPTYASACAKAGAERLYRWQYSVMQALQLHYPNARWSLKAPPHVFYLEQLLIVFPDARIYQSHRDPAKCIPSIANLNLHLKARYSDAAGDPHAAAASQISRWPAALDKVSQLRARPELSGQFIDMHFSQVIADPIGAVRAIYDYFSLDLAPGALEAMQRGLNADPHVGGSSHRYDLADFGLSEDEIEGQFSRYIDDYGVTRERRTS